MNRNDFLKTLALMPLLGSQKKLSALEKSVKDFSSTEKMPVLFLGHGSPMNAIEENEFVRGFRNVKNSINQPNAILCISAHWETKGTYVTAMQSPKTIHDFGGFPQALFDVEYPAPGSPSLAKEVKSLVKSTEVHLDEKWGLDHGAWSVIKHMYPKADIPVIQLSLDYRQSGQYHYTLAKQLAALRDKGVLIVGSGNMVHNLRKIAWDKMNADNYGFDWAVEASQKMKQHILDDNHMPLIEFEKQGTAFDLAIPTPEHYLPLLYTLGMKTKDETVQLFNDKAVAGSLTMTSVKIG